MRLLAPMLALLQGGGFNIFPIYFFWWAGGGWCGTPYPGWWRWPPPPPPPEPWWLTKIIGVVSGIAGGWVFVQVFKPGSDTVMSVMSVAGAFVASRVVGDLVSVARGAARAGRE